MAKKCRTKLATGSNILGQLIKNIKSQKLELTWYFWDRE